MATIVRAQDISTKTLPDSLHCRNQELARVHAHCPPYTNWRACIPELLEDALLAVNILCAFLVLHPHQCYYKLLVPSPWTIKFIYIYEPTQDINEDKLRLKVQEHQDALHRHVLELVRLQVHHSPYTNRDCIKESWKLPIQETIDPQHLWTSTLHNWKSTLTKYLCPAWITTIFELQHHTLQNICKQRIQGKRAGFVIKCGLDIDPCWQGWIESSGCIVPVKPL